MKIFHNKLYRYAIIALLGLLSGCDGLPENMVHRAEQIPQKISYQETLLKDERKAFDKLKEHKEWGFIASYLAREKWSHKLDDADAALIKAKMHYTTKIVPMLDRNEPDETNAFASLLYDFNAIINESTAAAHYPNKRISFLLKARDQAPQMHSNAVREHKEIKRNQEKLTTRAKNVIKKYPDKTDDINERIKELDEIVAEGTNSKTILSAEFRNKDNADYALFGDEVVKLTKTLKEQTNYVKNFDKKLDELYKNYVKILADQRIEFFVVIGRANWCESDYCYDGTEIKYPAIQVDEVIFEYYDSLTVETIATNRPTWGSEKFKLAIPNDKWGALKIQHKWNWPKGENYADYWVQNTYAKTYHRYTVIGNDKSTEGDWTEVSNDMYWQQNDNLGMAILSKPYGLYESDMIKTAQPVGMSTIATPEMRNGVAQGSNQYGEWRGDNGNSFWYYYAMYSFYGDLIGNSRYGYSDWNHYSRRDRSRSYYGRTNQYGTWGAKTYNNTRYSKSDFAKRNPGEVHAAKTGKQTRSNPSIRGAGKATRGRGAGGGGK